MLISNKLILEEFVRKHSRAVKPINKWVTDVTKATWATPQRITWEMADMFLISVAIILG